MGRLDITSGVGMWSISSHQETLVDDTPANFLWIFLRRGLEEIADCVFYDLEIKESMLYI